MNFKQLQAYLKELKKTKSLRQIASEAFGGRVNHAVIQRCLKGEEPTKADIRRALGLPNELRVPYRRNPVTGRYESLKRTSGAAADERPPDPVVARSMTGT